MLTSKDGVKLNHHDEKNVLLEFSTSKLVVALVHVNIGTHKLLDQHFVFPEVGPSTLKRCPQQSNQDLGWWTCNNQCLV